MISYEQFCRLKAYHDQHSLSIRQICRDLHLHHTTVARWLARAHYLPRQATVRTSKLDPYKPQIIRWLETHPYSATQVFLRLREMGYNGGITIVRDYVHKIRPPRTPAFLTLAFAPGDYAQVDWGQFGTIAVGNTQRRLSFFVMVLCYSRMLYVEFTLSETMEHFLACHQNAFAFFGGVPAKIMVDNLKSAVLQRSIGEDPVFNPRYRDFADYYGFKIKPCGVGQAHEKGRVENAVGYVKKNFLAGQEFTDFQPGQSRRPAVAGYGRQCAPARNAETETSGTLPERKAQPATPVTTALRCWRHPAGTRQQPVPHLARY